MPINQEISLYVGVTQNGSMNNNFFNEYLDQVVLPLFPKAKDGKVVRNKDGHLAHCPFIVKVDTGPGRLGATLTNIELRQNARKKGLILLLGLPNSTGVLQELNWLFRIFRCYCREQTLGIFSE